MVGLNTNFSSEEAGPRIRSNICGLPDGLCVGGRVTIGPEHTLPEEDYLPPLAMAQGEVPPEGVLDILRQFM
jgi:hypothetical protein